VDFNNKIHDIIEIAVCDSEFNIVYARSFKPKYKLHQEVRKLLGKTDLDYEQCPPLTAADLSDLNELLRKKTAWAHYASSFDERVLKDTFASFMLPLQFDIEDTSIFSKKSLQLWAREVLGDEFKQKKKHGAQDDTKILARIMKKG
jgi:hypothetical protein